MGKSKSQSPKMRIFTFFLAVGLTSATYAETCDVHLDDCSRIGDIVTITCSGVSDSSSTSTTSTTTTSTTTPSNETSSYEDRSMAVTCDAPEDYKYLLDAIKPDTTLDFNFCRKMCKIQARHGDAEACNYFRWETEKSNATTYCSLQTTCLSGEYNPTDPEGCQNNEHCRSGQRNCYEDGTPISSCVVPNSIDYHPNEFHVVCEDDDLLDINLYGEDYIGEDKPVPGDTICRTTRKCADWDDNKDDTSNNWRHSVIKCDGGRDNSRTNGTWVTTVDSGNSNAKDEMVADDGTILEPKCPTKCADLTLSTYLTQYWADLICDPPIEADHTLKDNEDRTDSCILTCDFHFKMTVDCNFKADGVKEWTDNHGNTVIDTDIQCDG